MLILTILKWLLFHARSVTALVEGLLPSVAGWPVIVFSIVFSIYWYGHSAGVDSCRAKQAKIEWNLEKKNDKNKTNNDKLVHNQLVNQLHKYQRD